MCNEQQTALVADGRYAIRNNNYGKAAECIRPYGGSGFIVTKSAAAGGGQDGAPVAYPEIFEGCHWDVCTQTSLPITVQEIGAAQSSWSTSQTADTTGDYNVAYDLWFNSSEQTTGQPDGAELMIWLDRQPAGPPPADSTVSWVNRTAFRTWTRTIRANDKTWPMLAYQLVNPARSTADLDLRSFIRDAVVRGIVKPSHHLVAVEAGFEIWSGGTGLRVDSFSSAVQRGYLVGGITSDTADRCVSELGDAAGSDGNPIGIDRCTLGSRQEWTIAIDGTIRHGGMCMGTTGAMIALHPCNGSPYQVWLLSGSGGLWNLGTAAQNNGNGLCLRDPSETGQPGTQLDLVNCDGSSRAQHWTLPIQIRSTPA